MKILSGLPNCEIDPRKICKKSEVRQRLTVTIEVKLYTNYFNRITVKSHTCPITNTTTGINSEINTLQNLTYVLGQTLDEAGNPLYRTMAAQSVPNILVQWNNILQDYGAGQEQLGLVADHICGSIKFIISKSEDPKNSTIFPNKDDVWRVQQQCYFEEEKLLEVFKLCKNWKAADGQQPLENLFLCVQQLQRMEESTCSCVRSGLSLYGWNETSLDTICTCKYT